MIINIKKSNKQVNANLVTHFEDEFDENINGN